MGAPQDDKAEEESPQRGLLQAAMDEFMDRTRAVVDLAGSVGSGALGAIPEPVPSTVTRMLSSLQQLAEQAMPLAAQLDVLLKEIHAKRLFVQALQAELAAFDDQLAILERSLGPLQTWSHQWNRIRESLTESRVVDSDGVADPDDET